MSDPLAGYRDIPCVPAYRGDIHAYYDAVRDVPRGFVSLADELCRDLAVAREQRATALAHAKATRMLPVGASHLRTAMAWHRIMMGVLWRMETLGIPVPTEDEP